MGGVGFSVLVDATKVLCTSYIYICVVRFRGQWSVLVAGVFCFRDLSSNRLPFQRNMVKGERVA